MTTKNTLPEDIRSREKRIDELTPEMETLKARLKATWMVVDYGYIAKYLEPCALEFLTHLSIQPGMRLLDVATGTGHAGETRRWITKALVSSLRQSPADCALLPKAAERCGQRPALALG